MSGTTAAFTSVGTTFSLAAGAPATPDAAGYAAVVWKEVGEVDSISEIKVTDAINSRVPLKTGVTTKTKGATTYEPFTLQGAWAAGDVGQAELKAAREAKAAYSYMIAYADGSKEYGRALITSRSKTPNDASSFTGFSATVEPTGASLEVLAP